TFTTGNDRPGVAHAAAGRCRATGDEAGDRLLHMLADVGCGCLFVGAADLADHEDAVGFVIRVEEFEAVDEVHAADRVAADAHAGRLTNAPGGALPHRFVGECAGAADDADRLARFSFVSRLVDVAGHDADLAALAVVAGGDDTGAVRADQPHTRVTQQF